eukprot:GFUD01132710.1.p1 GENE.GFUD01132710.1~~GFUD01132710.1.p1  ORF type:complete len:153 (+),score=38.38 GFUD01132710.1:2-460(+)
MYPQVFITFIFFLTPSSAQMEEIPSPCPAACPYKPPMSCTSKEITKDSQGCCDECAKAAGELCGGDSEILGKCSSGLKCNFDINAGICLKETGCKCNGLVLEVSGVYIGECSKEWDGQAFCFVNKMNTTCQDLQPSKVENLFWSFEACKNQF